MTTTLGPEIAATILRQLGGAGRLKAMIGAHNFLDHGGALSFRFRGSRKANYVKVELDRATDTYAVSFARIGRAPMFNVEHGRELFMVYADQLVELIERETGLYLSL